jgi:ABC-type glycerol-3-phosphate transport system permease component
MWAMLRKDPLLRIANMGDMEQTPPTLFVSQDLHFSVSTPVSATFKFSFINSLIDCLISHFISVHFSQNLGFRMSKLEIKLQHNLNIFHWYSPSLTRHTVYLETQM